MNDDIWDDPAAESFRNRHAFPEQIEQTARTLDVPKERLAEELTPRGLLEGWIELRTLWVKDQPAEVVANHTLAQLNDMFTEEMRRNVEQSKRRR